MITKQRLLVITMGAALACSCGAQAPPNDNAANGSVPSNLPAQAQVSGPGPAISPAQGQTAPDPVAPGQADPPARVARLANMSGNVSFTPAGEHDWVQAQLNRPVVTGDKLWTADGARAELQIGSSTVRLDYQSNFDFINLNDQIAQMQLTHGSLSLDVWRLRAGETYEVDTPTIAFIANRVGDYRVDVDSQGGFTTVTARRGGGEAVGEGGKRVVIEEGQSIRFNDSALNDYKVNVSSPDDFDLYCKQRQERHVSALARNYVSENVVGYEDLDEYGTWETAPQYGHVWYPTAVAADWAPYRAGHWIWVDPWGWTWVDDAPWGFAPFHYGRWAYVGTRWGWVPGPVEVAPVYAPALVAFVGGGGFGVNVSVGGPIGWFALGPGDAYFPGYYGGHDYFNRVNAGYVNQTVVNNYYGAWASGNVNYSQMSFANRNAPRALTAMPAAAFASGQAVATSAVAVNRTTMANARVLPRAMVTPTQTSLVAGRGSAAAPPSALENRTVVAAHTPPPATPSFAQRQSALQKSAGQPLSVNQMRTLSAQANGRSANAATAGNVRVVGARGAAAASRSMAAQTAGHAAPAANNGNVRGAGNNGSVSESHVRSAEFAHPGAGNATARGGNRAVPESVPSMTQRSASAPRGNANAPQNGRTTAAATREMPSATPSARASAAPSSSHASRQIRGEGQASAQPRVRQSAPMNRQPSYSLREPRAPAQQRRGVPSFSERGPAPQHSMPAQRGAPPQQQRPPMMAQHAPPPQQQRAPAPPRQRAVARQAPQPAPHGGNPRKKDGGG